jgi:hypothetical protein
MSTYLHPRRERRRHGESNTMILGIGLLSLAMRREVSEVLGLSDDEMTRVVAPEPEAEMGGRSAITAR